MLHCGEGWSHAPVLQRHQHQHHQQHLQRVRLASHPSQQQRVLQRLQLVQGQGLGCCRCRWAQQQGRPVLLALQQCSCGLMSQHQAHNMAHLLLLLLLLMDLPQPQLPSRLLPSLLLLPAACACPSAPELEKPTR